MKVSEMTNEELLNQFESASRQLQHAIHDSQQRGETEVLRHHLRGMILCRLNAEPAQSEIINGVQVYWDGDAKVFVGKKVVMSQANTKERAVEAVKSALKFLAPWFKGDAQPGKPRCPKCAKGASLVLRDYEDGYRLACGAACGLSVKAMGNGLEFYLADFAQFFPAARQEGWVSVTPKTMPKESEVVLLAISGREMAEMGWLRADCDEDECWQSVETAPQDEPIYFREDQVTHWRPLAEAPK